MSFTLVRARDNAIYFEHHSIVTGKQVVAI